MSQPKQAAAVIIAAAILGIFDVVVALFVGASHHLILISLEEAAFCLANAVVCAGFVRNRRRLRRSSIR